MRSLGSDYQFQCFKVTCFKATCALALSCCVEKSLCCVSDRIATIFSSMLCSDASTVIDKDLLWWFGSVWPAHNKLHSHDPTKCRAETSNHGYSALPPISIHGRACLSLPITTWCKKNLSFPLVEAAVHTWQDTIWRLSASTRMAPNFLAFEPFLMPSDVSKLLCDQLLIIQQVLLVRNTSLCEVIRPVFRSNFYSVPENSLSSSSKSLFFKHLN